MAESIVAIVLQLVPLLLKFAGMALDRDEKQKAIDAATAANCRAQIGAAQNAISALGKEYMDDKAAKKKLRDRVIQNINNQPK